MNIRNEAALTDKQLDKYWKHISKNRSGVGVVNSNNGNTIEYGKAINKKRIAEVCDITAKIALKIF